MAKDWLGGKTWSADQSQDQGDILSETVPEFFFGISILK